ncbi:MAG: hypothetical protein Q9207_008081 [Kuettlingeria erythrocarpa]
MTRHPSRLPSSLSPFTGALSRPRARYICHQCRYRASLQDAPSAPSRRTPCSTPSLRRTYASSRLERFQDAITEGLSKRLFKKGEAEEIIEQQKKKEPAPSPPQEPMPPIDDYDYTPALSGAELETIGGPTGWWEQAWDEEHQFEGFMRATPLRDHTEVRSAIGRALVEAVLLRQASRGSELQSAIERSLKHIQTSRPHNKNMRMNLVMNQIRPRDVPAIGNVGIWQKKDCEIRLDWARPEDKETICSFLCTCLQESTNIEKPGEVDGKLDVEDGQEESGEETTLSQLESDDPVEVARDSAVEIDEPREDLDRKAPEDDLATELAMVTSAEQERKSDEASYIRIHHPISLNPDLQAIMTTEDLYGELTHKAKPRKLADKLVLADVAGKRSGVKTLKPLNILPNVNILPSKYKPFMADGALGRQKVIEQRLEEHGIEEPWKDMMDRIEEHERNRLLKLGSALAESPPVHEGLSEGDTLDAAIMEGLPSSGTVHDELRDGDTINTTMEALPSTGTVEGGQGDERQTRIPLAGELSNTPGESTRTGA